MGISVPSLFGYRSGAIPISGKAWSKLEQAEHSTISTAGPEERRDDEGSVVSEDSPPTTEERLERVEALLERIAAALERMVDKEGGGNE